MGSQSSRQKKRRRRKTKRYLLHYILLIAFCAAVALTMCYTVFFKLDTIRISGNISYTEEEIIAMTGAQIGESLFRINTSNAEKKLAGKLHSIRSVKVKRRLPTSLQIIIEEEEAMACIYTPEGYAILSTTGRVMAVKAISPREGVPRVLGMEGLDYEEGTYLKTEPSNPKEAVLLPQVLRLQSFYKEMKAQGLVGFDYVDLSDEYNLKAMYEGRILIEFGTEHKMERKMLFLKEALEGKTEDFAKNPLPQECSIDLSDPVSLRFVELDIDRVKNPKGYAKFGEDPPPSGQAPSLQPENSSEDSQTTNEQQTAFPQPEDQSEVAQTTNDRQTTLPQPEDQPEVAQITNDRQTTPPRPGEEFNGVSRAPIVNGG